MKVWGSGTKVNRQKIGCFESLTLPSFSPAGTDSHFFLESLKRKQHNHKGISSRSKPSCSEHHLDAALETFDTAHPTSSCRRRP